MKQSRLSQFNEIKDRLDARAVEFIAERFPGGTPKVFYLIDVNYTKYKEGYHIAECPVTMVEYSWRLPWFQKRPSPEQIELARRKIDAALGEENIFFHTANGNISRAIPLCHIDNFHNIYGNKCSFDRSKLEPELARLIEVYVPKPGQFKCKYCGKAANENEKVKGTIIARQYPGMRATFDYCSAECNSHDQMGHEG